MENKMEELDLKIPITFSIEQAAFIKDLFDKAKDVLEHNVALLQDLVTWCSRAGTDPTRCYKQLSQNQQLILIFIEIEINIFKNLLKKQAL